MAALAGSRAPRTPRRGRTSRETQALKNAIGAAARCCSRRCRAPCPRCRASWLARRSKERAGEASAVHPRHKCRHTCTAAWVYVWTALRARYGQQARAPPPPAAVWREGPPALRVAQRARRPDGTSGARGRHSSGCEGMPRARRHAHAQPSRPSRVCAPASSVPGWLPRRMHARAFLHNASARPGCAPARAGSRRRPPRDQVRWIKAAPAGIRQPGPPHRLGCKRRSEASCRAAAGTCVRTACAAACRISRPRLRRSQRRAANVARCLGELSQ
jgi:hypothetical protein